TESAPGDLLPAPQDGGLVYSPSSERNGEGFPGLARRASLGGLRPGGAAGVPIPVPALLASLILLNEHRVQVEMKYFSSGLDPLRNVQEDLLAAHLERVVPDSHLFAEGRLAG